jgi:OOP family OmpA-OmpF porin
MKKAVSYAALIFAATIWTQACASSHHTLSFEPGAINTDRYVPKVDQFVVIADGSLSMADRWRSQQKMGISHDFLVSLNQTIPDLGYKGGLRAFGRGLCQSGSKTVSIIELGKYLGSSFSDGIARYHCANGTSPLNLAIEAADADLTDRAARTAIVIVSDGLNMGKKEVSAAKAMAAAFGDKLDIYAVQIGDAKKGRELLDEVIAAGGAGYLKAANDLTTSEAIAAFVVDVFLWPDGDGDGVPDHIDQCPDTPSGVEVDSVGCPVDSDGDGVPDYLDKCPGTPAGVQVDASGCPIDSDGDGVPDYLDQCPGTPAGVAVGSNGCPIDSDGDGVPDNLDKCPGTPKGVPVNDSGCPIAGVEVAGDEWFVRGQVLFDTNRATIKPEAAEVLLGVANFLTKNQQYMVEIQGNTDSTGPLDWNMKLSTMRAEAVKSYLVTNGVAAERLTTRGFGPNEPIAPNNTAEGRAKNRRVDFKPTVR